jgi:hypothetical protein
MPNNNERDAKGKRGLKCLSFQQPYAAMIALGIKTVECRTRKVKAPIKNLVVCASKTASIFNPIPALPYGYAMALVDVVDCVPFNKEHLKAAMMSQTPDRDSYAYLLENPRLIVPHPVHASASFFYVDFVPQIIEPTAESYVQHVLPVSQDGPEDFKEDILYLLFDNPDEFWDVFEL